jgi:hypothetical protein
MGNRYSKSSNVYGYYHVSICIIVRMRFLKGKKKKHCFHYCELLDKADGGTQDAKDLTQLTYTFPPIFQIVTTRLQCCIQLRLHCLLGMMLCCLSVVLQDCAVTGPVTILSPWSGQNLPFWHLHRIATARVLRYLCGLYRRLIRNQVPYHCIWIICFSSLPPSALCDTWAENILDFRWSS